MKTYKDYLIDFETLKVGDKVYSIIYGHGDVIEIKSSCSETSYPVVVKFGVTNKYYTKKGMHHVLDLHIQLFKEKPDFFKEKKEVKKWKWYYNVINPFGCKIENFSGHKTESEFKDDLNNAYTKDNILKYEKIDCTEITEMDYE